MIKLVAIMLALLAFTIPAESKTKKKAKGSYKTVIVSHPPGCPRRAFCGCGVSLKVYGERRRDLYLAANWLKFSRAKAAPGMVAARRGHVFYIVKVLDRGRVLAYDPNSGRNLTRIHVRKLAGFTVVNPKKVAL